MVISMLIRKVGRLNWKAYITRDQLCGLSLGLHLSQGAGFHQICLMFARCLFDVCSMFVRSCIRVYRQTNKQINKNRQKHYLLGGDNYYSNGGGVWRNLPWRVWRRSPGRQSGLPCWCCLPACIPPASPFPPSPAAKNGPHTGHAKNVPTCFCQNCIKSPPHLMIFGTQIARW